MVTRKEDTSKRVARRKYEEKNKELRKEKNANFQTILQFNDKRNEWEDVKKRVRCFNDSGKAYEIMKKED